MISGIHPGGQKQAQKETNVEMDKKQIESIFSGEGIEDFLWFDPHDIVVSQWVRMKCRFGCGEYGRNSCCPPNVPPVPGCRSKSYPIIPAP
jgi:predicted metal-binding protein